MAKEPQDTTAAAEQARADIPGRSTPADDTPGDEGRRAIFRVQGPALLAVFLLLVCIVPVATTLPGMQALFLLPLALAGWIVRTRTIATRRGLTVRTLIGTRELPWAALKGLSITPKSKVNAVLADGSTVPLPAVRARHLPVISLVSEGRLPDPSGVLDKPSADEPADGADATDNDTPSANGASNTAEAGEEAANTDTGTTGTAETTGTHGEDDATR